MNLFYFLFRRQVLDEDKREVRFLQELLLEDGENHGDAERERKFKWKNAGRHKSFLVNIFYAILFIILYNFLLQFVFMKF